MNMANWMMTSARNQRNGTQLALRNQYMAARHSPTTVRFMPRDGLGNTSGSDASRHLRLRVRSPSRISRRPYCRSTMNLLPDQRRRWDDAWRRLTDSWWYTRDSLL